MIIAYKHCIVWEEMGDVLHGLLEDGGWTSKTDLFEIDTALQCVSFVNYRSVLFDIDIALKCVTLVLID